ncbi:MAG: pentapeptide repeat-containing protein, partial [Chroococcales cyanobacterium]
MIEEKPSKFIATEPLGNAGESGEKSVWKAIQKAFENRQCLGYWRYPIFSQEGKFRKEPDILIADQEFGLIVIEVKSITLDQIVSISGHQWEYRNFYTTRGNPYQQAENQVFAILDYCKREPILQNKVLARALLALPQISRKEWQGRGLEKLPSSPPILFKENLEDLINLLITLKNTPPLKTGNVLTVQEWELLLSILTGKTFYSSPHRRVLASDKSRGSILNKIRDRISKLDLKQEHIAKEIPPGMQRIRGIAGSGKTILLCQKAAHMHLKHPNWDIAIVFFSRSLYQVIAEQIDQWLRYFSQSQKGYTSNNPKLRILHAWGSKKQLGLYSFLCQEARIYPLTVKDIIQDSNSTRKQRPNETLALACISLLKQSPIPQCFDAILIDEGQDLIVNKQFKFQNKQPFYWLAYQALRPVNPAQPDQKRLIWAYDEVQSLESLNVPTAPELFGEELGHLVTGNYPEGIQKTETLSQCYRTPSIILNAAYGIGMGILRSQGMLTGMTRPQEWEVMGYQVIGEFIPNSKVTLKYLLNDSPHPLTEIWKDSILDFKAYRTRQEELTVLSQNIFNNLRNEGLRPSREILVIVLGSGFEAIQLENDVANFLMSQGLDIYIPGTPDCNIISAKKANSNPNQFWWEGAVTISRIHRAKGHEADMVYLVGFDKIAQDESNLYLRNQLLIALTRSKAWVKMSGIGAYPMYEEMYRVMQSGNTFTFTYRSPPKREISVTDVGELLKGYTAGGRNFQNADLKKANLVAVDLRNVNLIGAMLKGANLSHAKLDEAKLVIADLTGVNLSHASLYKAKLVGAMLQGSQLRGADLSYADLRNADLRNANLIGANLTGANLSAANVTGANLTGAILNGAEL